MVGGPQSWELQCSLAVLGKSGAGEVQQRRTGQALGSSVRRKRRREGGGGGRGDGDIRLLEEKDTIFCGLGRGVAASDIRAVCTLHFSTNDERHIPTNGLAWQTRTAGMGEEACLHDALRSRHDLHAAIGWCEASKRVVNGVYYEIIVYSIVCTNVGDGGRLARKAIGHKDYFQRC